MKTTERSVIEIAKSKIVQIGYHDVINILLVVATDTELNTVIEKIQPLPSASAILKCFDGQQTYYLGVLGCFPICLVKTTMMGSLKRDASLTAVTDALASWNIKTVIMPGIAFGRDEKKQSIGDILISEILSQYETVKEDKGDVTINRGHSVPASSTLLNRFAQESSWMEDNEDFEVNISRCELLSGEKLINDLAFKTSLFERFPNAKGGEMEGNGVYAACDKNKVDWIICKSICDWADGKKDDKWQKLAARNSIGYVNHVLSDSTVFNELRIPSIHDEELDKVFYGENIDYSNILGMDIVNIIFPKHTIIEYPNVSLSKERVYYEFIEVQLTDRLKIGYLFFAKQINIDKTVKHFCQEQKHNYNSLVVCSPRVKSDISGKDDYRLTNIEKKFNVNEQFNSKVEVQFKYIEDLTWESCMSHNILLNENDIPDEKYFIDQEISYSNINGEEKTEKSLKYFSSIIENGSISKPLIAVLGGAGVGKTTLCDQLLKLICLHQKKKAIYISSSDIEVNDSTAVVRTVTDLYKLTYTDKVDQDEELLDPSNLAVNISCGNIIVIIDGLDEIESKLKDRFKFDEFIVDAENLNSSYNNCTIIVTSRDYYKNKYENNINISPLLLLGFDDNLAEKYFLKRVSKSLSEKASTQLKALNISDNGYYPPVILSLVCDILESEEKVVSKVQSVKSFQSKYLFSGYAFDSLIIKLIDREIERQTLHMKIDDVIDLLFEIAATRKGEMFKDELNDYLRMYGNDNNENSFSSFYVNPLLRSTHNNEKVTFRYDNLLLILRSRRFNYIAGRDLNSTSFTKTALLEFYDGKGDLIRDIISNNSYNEEVLTKVISSFITELVDCTKNIVQEGNISSIEKNKKYTSAIIYYFFGCFPNLTRTERSEKLLILFSGHIKNLFVYSNFFPLDFTNITVHNSGFFDYENFEKSSFPVNKKVFYNTTFVGIEPKANLDAEMNVFDDSCRINDRLKHAIIKGEDNKADLLKFIKSDFITIFRVLYKNRMFVSKSENIFRNKKNKIYPKLGIDDYVSFFFEKGVFERENSYSSESKYHYSISKPFMNDIRYLITNNNFRNELDSIYREFIFKRFGIEY